MPRDYYLGTFQQCTVLGMLLFGNLATVYDIQGVQYDVIAGYIHGLVSDLASLQQLTLYIKLARKRWCVPLFVFQNLYVDLPHYLKRGAEVSI